MSIAHGGQIVVTDATALLLRDRALLRPLGEHRLRGLEGRTTVYQIVADGLSTEFPPLASGGQRTGNLPQDASPFVGRDSLLEEVVDLVKTNSLVTLGGVGGVGKTRLALEAAAAASNTAGRSLGGSLAPTAQSPCHRALQFVYSIV